MLRDVRTVYGTCDEHTARRIAKEGKPCIFLAKEGGELPWGIRFVSVGAPEQEYIDFVWHRHYGLPRTIALSERLEIRESVTEDLRPFVRMYAQEAGNPDVEPLAADVQEQLAAYIQNQYEFYEYGLWTVVERASGRVIGRAGLENAREDGTNAGAAGADGANAGFADAASTAAPPLELSYLIERGARGRGYGLEAARMILRYARERFGGGTVQIQTSVSNMASRRMARQLEAEFPIKLRLKES